MAEVHVSENTKALRDTDKALLVEFEDGTEKWIPKSVIEEDSEVYKIGTSGTLVVKQWFAEKEELP
jgi:hypothetical protein